MKKVLTLILALMALGAPTGASAAISGTTETRQFVFFTGVKPNTQYSVLFYAYHYPTDVLPYAYGYGGYESNSFGQFKASRPISDLAQHYEGKEGPVYSVRACLLESLNTVACTATEYAGYLPQSLWTYTG